MYRAHYKEKGDRVDRRSRVTKVEPVAKTVDLELLDVGGDVNPQVGVKFSDLRAPWCCSVETYASRAE